MAIFRASSSQLKTPRYVSHYFRRYIIQNWILFDSISHLFDKMSEKEHFVIFLKMHLYYFSLFPPPGTLKSSIFRGQELPYEDIPTRHSVTYFWLLDHYIFIINDCMLQYCNFCVRRNWQLRDCCVPADIQLFCHGLGRHVHFVEPDVKVNAHYYRDTFVLEGMLREIHAVSGYFIFSKPVSWHIGLVRQSSNWNPKRQTLLRPPTLWPQNSPDFSPVDYIVWSVLQENVWVTSIKSSTLASCVSALCLHGTNFTSEWSTQQSSSGELVFAIASRQKATIQLVRIHVINMHIWCLFAFEALTYICCRSSFWYFCFNRGLRALIFTRPQFCKIYNASTLKVWWEMFTTFNVAKGWLSLLSL